MMDEPEIEEISEVAAEPNDVPGARLVYKPTGVETDTEFPIGHGAVVGRFDAHLGAVDVDCAGLAEGMTVSRRHARFDLGDAGWSIEDLGSSNGTYVLRDGQFERVVEADLTDGDELAFGEARFVLRLS